MSLSYRHILLTAVAPAALLLGFSAPASAQSCSDPRAPDNSIAGGGATSCSGTTATTGRDASGTFYSDGQPGLVINVAKGNVAAGSTDAVNGDQLNTTNQNVSTAQNTANVANSNATAAQATADRAGNGAANVAGSLGGGATYNTSTGSYTGPVYTVQGSNQTSVGGALSVLDGAVTAAGTVSKYVDINASGAAAQADGTDSIAIGPAAIVGSTGNTDQNSIAIGNAAQVTNSGLATSNNIAIGTNAFVGGTNDPADSAIAIGTSARAARSNALAIGNEAIASFDGIALGLTSNSNTIGSVAIGNGAIAGKANGGPGGVSVGLQAITEGNGVAIGSGAYSGNNEATVIGDGAAALAYKSTALGANATAANQGDVALGYGSVTAAANPTASATVSGTIYTGFAGSGPTSVVSIGGGSAPGDTTRQITNLAAGRITATSTDAINGSQLYSTLSTTNATLANLSTGVTAATDNATAAQASAAAANTAITSIAGSLGGGANSDPSTGVYTAPSYTVQGSTQSNVGGAVAALDQGLTTTAATAANSVQYDDAAKTAVTLAGAGSGTPVAVHNVAGGTLAAGSTDAVNAGQLYTTNQNVAAVQVSAATANTNLTTLTSQINAGAIGLVQQDPTTRAITMGAATDGTSVSIAGTAGDRMLTGVAAGAVAAGSSDAINGGQLAATNAHVADNASAIAALANGSAGIVQRTAAPNQVLLTAAGGTSTTPGPAQILGNVQAGTLSASSTDAVNGSQLYATNQMVSAAQTSANSANTGAALAQSTADRANAGVAQAVGVLGGGAAYDSLTGTLTAPVYHVQAGTQGNVGAALTALDDGLNTVAAAAANSVQYDNPNKTSVTLGGVGATTPVVLRNVAAGNLAAGSTDAVNGDQLATTDSNLVTTNTALTGLVGQITSGTIGLVQQDPTTRGITVGGSTDGSDISIAGSGGSRTLSGIAPGSLTAGSSQAVNGGQVAALGTSVAANLGAGASFDPASGSITSPGYSVAGATYTNVGSAIGAIDQSISGGAGIKYFRVNSAQGDASAAGVDSLAAGPMAVASGTGAVAIGSGAIAQNGTAVSIGRANVASGDGAVAIGDPNIATGTGVLALGQNNEATGIGAVALGATNTAIGQGAVALGNASTARGSSAIALGDAASAADRSVAIGGNSTASATNSVALGAGSVAARGAQTGYAAFGTVTPQTSVGEVSLGAAGAERQVTNVAAGSGDTDAANVGQLKGVSAALGTSIATDLGGNAAYDPASAIVTPPTYVVQGGMQTTVAGAVTVLNTSLTNIVDGQSGVARSDNSNGAVPPVASGANAAALGFGASATAAQSVALGNGATSSGSGSVALGSDSTDAGQPNVVSVGSVGDERRITNVAPGSSGTDAVDVNQLAASSRADRAYTDQRIAGVQFDLAALRKDADAGVAGALAAAGLPQAYEPGRSMIAGGFGSFQGQSAFALGISRVMNDGHTIAKLGMSHDLRGRTGVNTGLGYQF